MLGEQRENVGQDMSVIFLIFLTYECDVLFRDTADLIITVFVS